MGLMSMSQQVRRTRLSLTTATNEAVVGWSAVEEARQINTHPAVTKNRTSQSPQNWFPGINPCDFYYSVLDFYASEYARSREKTDRSGCSLFRLIDLIGAEFDTPSPGLPDSPLTVRSELCSDRLKEEYAWRDKVEEYLEVGRANGCL